eukprot:5559188-Alexandrium_andersonii.AAC.1
MGSALQVRRSWRVSWPSMPQPACQRSASALFATGATSRRPPARTLRCARKSQEYQRRLDSALPKRAPTTAPTPPAISEAALATAA